MRMRDNANHVEHHARAACLHNQCRTCTQTLLYYDLFLAARSAPSQLCLYDTACSGCSYMMEYIERVQQGASEASPPACIYYLATMYLPIFINPRRMREGYGSLFVCVCVCLSVTTLAASYLVHTLKTRCR